jgi:RNA polymerase sigma-70 factor (ECF subfamily)
MTGEFESDTSDTAEPSSRKGPDAARALVDLFAQNRERLRRMVSVRLDHRLRGRIDPSDVLQEAQIDVLCRANEYAAAPSMPPYLWLRFLTVQRLLALHRVHLGAQMRDAGQEVPLARGRAPEATSESLAASLLGRLTSPSLAAERAEFMRQLNEALSAMEPIDREVLILRHFEELTNAETAEVLGLQKTAASNRYVRALKRLRGALGHMPGFLEP